MNPSDTNPYNLSPELLRMATQLAEKHREPNEVVVHPKVYMRNGDGTVDIFMMDKVSDNKYVPYCLSGGCGRMRRREYGFYCPTCCKKTNWDLTRFNNNKDVEYVNGPPSPKPVVPLTIQEWNKRVTDKKYQRDLRRVTRKGE